MKKIVIFVGILVLVLSAGLLCSAAKPSQAQSGKEKSIQSQVQNSERNMGNANNTSQNDPIGQTASNDESTASLKSQNKKMERIQQQTEANYKNKGQSIANTHRSNVANFVQNLLQTAKTAENQGETNIGRQVRAIAMQQSTEEAATETAMERIQTRSKIKTFFLGPDWKNIGQLRSSYVQTRNRIRQLTRLMNQAQDPIIKESLKNQIEAEKVEQQGILNFIKQEENKFSLLGWFTKLFFPSATEEIPEDTGDLQEDTNSQSSTGENLPSDTAPQIPTGEESTVPAQ